MSNTTLGIDVGKYELAVALLKDGKFTDKSFENNPKGFQQILKFLEKEAPRAEVYLEATGRYGEAVTDFLFDREFDVKVINPAQIRAFAQAKLARHKTDRRENHRRVRSRIRRKKLLKNQGKPQGIEGALQSVAFVER